MKINGKTDIGCNRAENQDTFRSGSLRGGGSWGVVCDGMGGAQNGRLASAVAADCVEEMLYQQMEAEPDGDPRQMLNDAIQLANAEVYALSGEGKALMGTTVVCALVRGDLLHLAHVGDSRAYLYEDGELTRLTRDHSMVQELVDKGTLTPAEASHHPEKNVITRALGVEGTVQPSFGSRRMEKGNLVLLCSDGLTNMVEEGDIARLIESSSVWELPDRLVQAALNAGGDDNITVLVMGPDDDDFVTGV